MKTPDQIIQEAQEEIIDKVQVNSIKKESVGGLIQDLAYIQNDIDTNFNVVAHWDFSELSHLNDGDKISILDDITGYGNPLTNPVIATQPTKSTLPNGKAVATFNGTQKLQNLSLGTSMLLGSALTVPLTVVIVFKANSSQSTTVPSLFKSSTATPLNIIINNPVSAKTETMYMVGNSLTSSVRGPSIMDNNWHVSIITVDTNNSFIYMDGYLFQTLSGGNLLGTSLTNPILADLFSGQIAEVVLMNQRVNQNVISHITNNLSSKWGIATSPQNVSNGNAGSVFEDTTTPDGNTVRIWTPSIPAENAPLIIYCHPQAQNEKITLTSYAFPYIHAATSLGWYVAGSSMGTASTPGGSASSWGNPTAQESILELYNLMMARRNFTKVIMIGASMGGAASALALIKNTIPISAIYFIDPALSLLEMYKSAAYTATIDAGYSITSGTLSSPSIAGDISISSSISFANGTKIIIDPNGTNPEQVITGIPSGSGPYTIPLTTALSFNHSSGVKVSDYGTKTAGFDAMIESKVAFTDKPIRFLASPTDTTTVETLHTIPFQAQISPIAQESVIVDHLGGHLAGGATNSKDFVSFVNRVLST